MEKKAATPTSSTRTKSRRKIARAIRLVWESLDSHIDASIGTVHKNPCCNRAVGSPSFHKKCVREYIDVLDALTELL